MFKPERFDGGEGTRTWLASTKERLGLAASTEQLLRVLEQLRSVAQASASPSDELSEPYLTQFKTLAVPAFPLRELPCFTDAQRVELDKATRSWFQYVVAQGSSLSLADLREALTHRFSESRVVKRLEQCLPPNGFDDGGCAVPD